MSNTFDTLGLGPKSLKAVKALGFTEPTPVQQQAIPLGLEGHDVLAAAQTGTGKTAAYLLPIFDQLIGNRPNKKEKGPFALVLSPTRELTQQIDECARTIGKVAGFSTYSIIGGKKYSTQINALNKGCDVLIATPGRLLDLLDQKALSLENVRYLVLDEVDRMLDMGFWPSVHNIVRQVPKQRQTFLLSATITSVVADKSHLLQTEPKRVEISHEGEKAEAVEDYLMPVSMKQKPALLAALLKAKGTERVIIFTHTKVEADSIARRLEKDDIKVDSIHSDKTQGKRDRALKNFKQGKVDVLVATDVLARGIDIDEVSYVINYTVPNVPEDYVHRIGRTGRAGETGAAYTFMTPEQLLDLREIEYFTKKIIPTYDLEGFEYDAERLVPKSNRPAKRVTRKSNAARRLSRRR